MAGDHTGGPPATPTADRVAVVVATRDRPEELERCLVAVAAAVRPADEVVVADSASTDPAVRRVAEDAGATVVRCNRPGASRARNAGAGASTAPLLAFTDDDCRPRPGWAAALAAAFADPLVGFVTGRVDADEGDATAAVLEHDRPRRFAGEADPILIGHGANMAVRRVAFEAIGGFDPVLGAGAPFRGAEDHDVFFRVLAAGWHGTYEPSAGVAHRQWRTRGEALRLQAGYGLGSGAFAAKIVRASGGPGWRLLGRRVWQEGAARAWRDLRGGYEFGAAVSAVRTAGVLVGAARGWTTPLAGDRYDLDW